MKEEVKKQKGCLIGIILITTVIGIFNHTVLLIPISIVGIWIVMTLFKSSQQKKLIEHYRETLISLGQSKQADELSELISEVQDKLTIKDRLDLFLHVYFNVIETFIKGNKLSKEEIRVVDIFEAAFDGTQTCNSAVVMRYLNKTNSDNINTAFIDSVLRHLKLSKAQSRNLIDIKIKRLEHNGLTTISKTNDVVGNRICYYMGKVVVMRTRSKDGTRYQEADKTADLYIFDKNIELVFNGHRSISLNEIIQTNMEDDVYLLLTIRNIGVPLILASVEPQYIEAIISKIKQSQTL